ncbi:spore cortex biosynthesis protein YabQ [Peribacillus loiseleuriae]|uniref:Spore coat protein n=1 Tax=Peribacillus loiseleuriae TaxID=1679170 RepID=A0A0K9GNC0_9BACI|nr:spore cortex biosynthesis protein YabQ [Peribacillus loiseleuriae]KMY48168.1 spore coat protein [Peribacillus loiseleuriae]
MTLTIQFYTLLAMIGMGSCFGAALDTYNRFLKRTKRRAWFVFLNDFLFWVVQGLIIFYVLFLINEGEFRFYLFLALLCGFSAYQALLKKSYHKILEAFITSVIATAKFMRKSFQLLIYQPIKWLVTGIVFLIFGIGKVLFSIVKWIIRLIFITLKVILRPFFWIFLYFWNKLPNAVTKNVGKFYNEITGIFIKMKKFIKVIVVKWRSKKI